MLQQSPKVSDQNDDVVDSFNESKNKIEMV